MRFPASLHQQLLYSVIKNANGRIQSPLVTTYPVRFFSDSGQTQPPEERLNKFRVSDQKNLGILTVPPPLPSYLLEFPQFAMAKPANSTEPDVKPNLGLELLSKDRCFDGHQSIYRHYSEETKCNMKFSIYIPTGKVAEEKFHALFFFSGVMCNEQNFIFKTGFQRYASEHRIIFIGSDTSPRNVDIPGDRDNWVFGRSAGWYLDAVQEPWNRNYRMYSYVTKELPDIIRNNFPVTGNFGVCGHSMGGNGAIVCGLRNPTLFQTISVLAPSCNPSHWGAKLIYEPYLGEENKQLWKQYDAYHIAKGYQGPPRKILVDCGSDDEYLHLLVPDKLEEAGKENARLEVDLRMREGYNHNYYFVATFIQDHIKFHAEALSALKS